MRIGTIDPACWRGRKVLVTGHTGFKGSWLTAWLHRLGAEVLGYALPPDGASYQLYRDSGLARDITSVEGDVCDREHLWQTAQAFAPELVLHLAAQSLVRPSYDNPVDTYAVNVMGTVHLLDAVRRLESAKAAVVVTTDKCYENREWLWPYRENDRLGGHDPYSNSKACAELVSDAFRRSYFASGRVLLATARAGNVIGGGDLAVDRLLPDAVRAFSQDLPLAVRNPNATRPWQHVLDPLHGYLLLAQSLLQGQSEQAGAFNFGPPDEHTVGAVVTTLAQRWEGARVETPEGDYPHEAARLHLDSRKAQHTLGWKPHFDFASGLEATVEFYRSWLQEPSSARRLMDAQIAAFEA